MRNRTEKKKSDFSSMKNKINPISIKNETILANILQKNIENKLLFSRSKKKIKILSIMEVEEFLFIQNG